MKKKREIIACLAALCFLTMPIEPSVYGLAVPSTGGYYKMPAFFEGRLPVLREMVEFPAMPRLDKLRRGCVIDESWLSNPGSISRKRRSVSGRRFKDQGWIGGICEFSADRLVNFDEKEYEESRQDPHRKPKRYAISGELRVRICNAPNTEAALEYLLVDDSLSSMGDIALAAFYSESNRVEGLGTIGFREQYRSGNALVMFVRDNIAVIIRARGELASEGLPLAQKIDSAILGKPALTYEQLLARRPSITMAKNAEKVSYGSANIPFEVSPPAAADIVGIKAYVNDAGRKVKDGRILMGGKTGAVKAKVTVITSELIRNTREFDVVIPEKSSGQD